MRSRIPWLTLGLLVFVLIVLFEPDIVTARWDQVAFKAGAIGLLCLAVWAWHSWQTRA